MRQVLGFLILFVCGNLAAEGTMSPAETLQTRLLELTSFSASFKQSTHEQDGFLLDEQSGKLYFSRPSLLRWEAEQPFAQTLVADGIDIYLYDPDLDQVTIRAWSSNPLENPAAIFVSEEDVSAHFSIAEEGDSYLLTPFADQSTVAQLTLEFRQGIPTTLEILDTLGQITRIEFSDQEVGPVLAPEMFEFVIPDGAEVITDG